MTFVSLSFSMIAVERRCRDVCEVIWLLVEAVLMNGLSADVERVWHELVCGAG